MIHGNMKPTPYRHPAPTDVRLEALVRQQPNGTGVSVTKYPPYWEVVARANPDTGKIEYIVTDCSRPEPHKPLRVHGPETRTACESWARTTQQLFFSTHVQFAADSIEYTLGGQ